MQLRSDNPNPRLAVRLPLTAARLVLLNAELKKCLRAVFCQFGTILDVVLCKAYKLRGQAWVVFSTVEEATEAKAMIEGFPLYEKPLVRARVRRGQPPLQLTQRAQRSALSLRAPSRTSWPRRTARSSRGLHTTKRSAWRRSRVRLSALRACGGQHALTRACARAVEANKKRRAKEAAAAAAPPSIASAAPPRIAPTIAPTPAPFPLPTMGRPPYGGQDGPALPHKILFLQVRCSRAGGRLARSAALTPRSAQQGLPESIEASVLKALFVQFPGFREVRLIEARPGIAFVEFENEMQAGVALAGLQSFKVDEDHTMIITYAKR